ncbi:MAG: hypothetical protein PHU27_03460 [Salinivirgaceae bacterium]|nr:hypothetical protein [Salinivirgaceae bacterium]
METYETIITESLQATMGNAMKHRLAQFVVETPKSIPFLWSLIATKPYPINARAAWVFEYLCTNNEVLFWSYIEAIAISFPKTNNESVMRILSKLLMLKPIPEKEEAKVLNAAFDRLTNKALPIALRVNCMQIVYNLTSKHPDLQNELRGIIENEIETGKPAFKSRGWKILTQLNLKRSN